MTSHITVVGSINADLSVRVNRHPKPGETIFGTGGSISPGGKGANQAVAAARGGVRVPKSLSSVPLETIPMPPPQQP